MFRKNNSVLARLPRISAKSNENYRPNFQALANISGKYPEIPDISQRHMRTQHNDTALQSSLNFCAVRFARKLSFMLILGKTFTTNRYLCRRRLRDRKVINI